MGMPFGEDVLTIIMGLDDPCEPGMHGKVEEACPTDDAVTLVAKIRDMCDQWLRSSGKMELVKDDETSAEQAPEDGEDGDM